MSWWWTGRPGVLWFMGLQRVGHDWATELNWISHQQGVHIIGGELSDFSQTEPTHVTSTQFQKQNLLAPRAFLCSVLSLSRHKEDMTRTRTPEVRFVCFCISWKQDYALDTLRFCLLSFNTMFMRLVSIVVCNQIIHSHCHVVFHCVATPQFMYSLDFCWAFGSLPIGLLNWSCCKHCCLNNQGKGSPVIKVHKRKSQDL